MDMQIKTNAKPFIKWAGGKGQLLSQLDNYLPQELFTEPFTYIEPFVGGGAMLFHMLQKFPNISSAVINDINEDLTKAYRVVMKEPTLLIKALKDLESEYLPLEDEERKNMFLQKRSLFNLHKADDITNTALLMFLNKTCFNGLFRVNRKGEFNVPFGRYNNPIICNATTIMADSVLLNSVNITITQGDFKETSRYIDQKEVTFFYLDPPYRPLTETSSFTSYTKGDFNDREQQRLADFCREIGLRNCLWLQSNSDGSSQDPNNRFFDTLYQDYKIERVYATRFINSNPTKRGSLTELVIHNVYTTYKESNKTLFKVI